MCYANLVNDDWTPNNKMRLHMAHEVLKRYRKKENDLGENLIYVQEFLSITKLRLFFHTMVKEKAY